MGKHPILMAYGFGGVGTGTKIALGRGTRLTFELEYHGNGRLLSLRSLERWLVWRRDLWKNT